ncbi:MAG: hypothetical protein V8T36_05905 [Ruthenibacterium lactatiformans]
MKDGGDRYRYTFFEQVWSPKEAKNPELADKFIAFLYSDEAAEIFRQGRRHPAHHRHHRQAGRRQQDVLRHL